SPSCPAPAGYGAPRSAPPSEPPVSRRSARPRHRARTKSDAPPSLPRASLPAGAAPSTPSPRSAQSAILPARPPGYRQMTSPNPRPNHSEDLESHLLFQRNHFRECRSALKRERGTHRAAMGGEGGSGEALQTLTLPTASPRAPTLSRFKAR